MPSMSSYFTHTCEVLYRYIRILCLCYCNTSSLVGVKTRPSQHRATVLSPDSNLPLQNFLTVVKIKKLIFLLSELRNTPPPHNPPIHPQCGFSSVFHEEQIILNFKAEKIFNRETEERFFVFFLTFFISCLVPGGGTVRQ